MLETTPTSTTTTIDPLLPPLVTQRIYNTKNNGIGEPTVVLLFVVVIVFAVVAGYLVGRYGLHGRHTV